MVEVDGHYAVDPRTNDALQPLPIQRDAQLCFDGGSEKACEKLGAYGLGTGPLTTKEKIALGGIGAALCVTRSTTCAALVRTAGRAVAARIVQQKFAMTIGCVAGATAAGMSSDSVLRGCAFGAATGAATRAGADPLRGAGIGALAALVADRVDSKLGGRNSTTCKTFWSMTVGGLTGGAAASILKLGGPIAAGSKAAERAADVLAGVLASLMQPLGVACDR